MMEHGHEEGRGSLRGKGGKKRKGREEARREAGKKEWKRSLFPPRIGYEGEVMSRCQNGRGRQAKEDERETKEGKKQCT